LFRPNSFASPPSIDKHIIPFYIEKVYQAGFNIEQLTVAHTDFPHFGGDTPL